MIATAGPVTPDICLELRSELADVVQAPGDPGGFGPAEWLRQTGCMRAHGQEVIPERLPLVLWPTRQGVRKNVLVVRKHDFLPPRVVVTPYRGQAIGRRPGRCCRPSLMLNLALGPAKPWP